MLRPSIAIVLAALVVAVPACGGSPSSALECPVFPRSNPWNQSVDRLPLHPRSDSIVASVGLDDPLYANFGAGSFEGAPIGMPYTTVSKSQSRVQMTFERPDESDPGPYPIPDDAPIEAGDDRHVIVVDRDRCRLYELFAAHRISDGGGWRAFSGATWDLHSNRVRPAGHTSADAAGLPILAGLARPEEIKRGRIDHALRFTVRRTRRGYVYPARHSASSRTDPGLPAMGQRFRLRRDFDISRYPRQARIVLAALKRYGMMVADHGSNWYVSGVPSSRWDDGELRTLGGVRGRDFEVVDTRTLPRP